MVVKWLFRMAQMPPSLNPCTRRLLIVVPVMPGAISMPLSVPLAVRLMTVAVGPAPIRVNRGLLMTMLLFCVPVYRPALTLMVWPASVAGSSMAGWIFK
jgi:hypothetical protein